MVIATLKLSEKHLNIPFPNSMSSVLVAEMPLHQIALRIDEENSIPCWKVV